MVSKNKPDALATTSDAKHIEERDFRVEKAQIGLLLRLNYYIYMFQNVFANFFQFSVSEVCLTPWGSFKFLSVREPNKTNTNSSITGE